MLVEAMRVSTCADRAGWQHAHSAAFPARLVPRCLRSIVSFRIDRVRIRLDTPMMMTAPETQTHLKHRYQRINKMEARARSFAVALLWALLYVLGLAAGAKDVCEVKEKEVVDKVTGIAFPTHRSFAYAGRKDFSLLGAGPRRKNLFVVEVNVYSVGLYLDSSYLYKLKGFKGKAKDALAKDKSYYAALQKPGLNRALHLIFARSVPAAKVVDALSSIPGVKAEVLKDFSETLLNAIGANINKGESVTLAWTADDKLALQVREKVVKTFASADLARGIFGLYLGDKAISPEAKAGFAAVTPELLK